MGLDKNPSFRFLAIRHYQVVEQREWQPALNIYETDDAVHIVAELAGVDPEHLEVEAEPNLVRIQATRRSSPPQNLRRIHRMEITAGSFQIEVPLAAVVEPGNATSDYQHGLLTITLPLAKRQAQRLAINVNSVAADTDAALDSSVVGNAGGEGATE